MKLFKWIKRIFYRSAVTGRFVSKEEAEKNPDTTVKETRKVKKVK